MAWQTPVTDRTSSSEMTADDINRIVGNILVVYPSATFTKTIFTADDFVDVVTFGQIITNLSTICTALGINSGGINTVQIYSNINNIENLTLMCKTRIDLIAAQAAANIYAGELYVGDSNYIRGH